MGLFPPTLLIDERINYVGTFMSISRVLYGLLQTLINKYLLHEFRLIPCKISQFHY